MVRQATIEGLTGTEDSQEGHYGRSCSDLGEKRKGPEPVWCGEAGLQMCWRE